MGSGGREARVCLAFLQFLRAGEIYIGGRGTGEIRAHRTHGVALASPPAQLPGCRFERHGAGNLLVLRYLSVHLCPERARADARLALLFR